MNTLMMKRGFLGERKQREEERALVEKRKFLSRKWE